MGKTKMVYPIIIVGAGPAGLSVAACLKQQGISSLILEKAEKPGASWHKHYERLHLHTARAFSSLPYLPIPKQYGRYPSREQMTEYFANYAKHFGFEIAYGEELLSAKFAQDFWELESGHSHYKTSQLVIATGYNRVPYCPSWSGQGLYKGIVLHSTKYKRGDVFKGQNVLVVGFGNSGGEIAIDLYEQGAKPSMSVRGPINVIPRDLLGIPIQAIAIAQSPFPATLVDRINSPIIKAVKGDLRHYGLNKADSGSMAQIKIKKRIPLIDVGTVDLIKKGKICIYPGIDSFEKDAVIFTDGRKCFFDSIILATGYQARVNAFLPNLDGVFDEKGQPLISGSESAMLGLYFCGYKVVATGVLREINLEAKRLSALIAQNLTKRQLPK